MRVTIHGPNGMPGNGPSMHVHATGCADLNKPLYRHNTAEAWSMDADSAQEVVEATYSDQMAEADDEWATWEPYADDFKFFPCTKSLPTERQPES